MIQQCRRWVVTPSPAQDKVKGTPMPGLKRTPLAVRFWKHVNKDGPLPDFAPHLGKCWLWLGSKSDRGYGLIQGDSERRLVGAHRASYELAGGKIPDGLDIDHLCRVRHCVNPAHLEPVTRQVNARRGAVGMKTACVHGHPYDEANTRMYHGVRVCRACNQLRHIERRRAIAAVRGRSE